MVNKTNPADASASMTGYLFQLRFALFQLLKATTDEASVTIELLDDVALDDGDSNQILYQLKHYRADSVITEASESFWKTLKNWLNPKLTKLHDAQLIFVTTSRVPSHSILCTLKNEANKRNNSEIADKLCEIAQKSQSLGLKPAFESYLGLNAQERTAFINCITLIDGSESISDYVELIQREFKCRAEHRPHMFQSLEGWWQNRVIQHLTEKDRKSITYAELVSKLDDIRQAFLANHLPIEYANAKPPEDPNPNTDTRQFIAQLRAIELDNDAIKFAIIDYYRAFEQRSKWVRDRLIFDDELAKYEARLVEEFERKRNQLNRARLRDEDETKDDISLGVLLFDWAQDHASFVRPAVTEQFISRGSYHMLADNVPPQIAWHPKFITRLNKALEAAGVTVPAVESTVPLPTEVFNLQNPAFCTRILRCGIKGYHETTKSGMPYSLAFLILPIVLSKAIRSELPSSRRTKLHTWIRSKPQTRILFQKNVKQLIPSTRDGLRFGLNRGVFEVKDDAEIYIVPRKRLAALKTTDKSPEIEEIERRAEFVGRWFGDAGSSTMIYRTWGVRP